MTEDGPEADAWLHKWDDKGTESMKQAAHAFEERNPENPRGELKPLFSADTIKDVIIEVSKEAYCEGETQSGENLCAVLVSKFQEESGESSFSSSEQIQESLTDGDTGPVEGAEELPKTFAGKTSKLYNLLEEKQTQFEKGSEPWIALDLFVSDLWTKVFEKNRDR